jgi:putative FmdB family regulatory protein
MPIYEYQCNKCGNVFEVLQKFSDAPVKKHEKCGGKVERLISRSGFQLKGGGWYATDYAHSSKGEKPSAKEDSKAEASSSDSKPSESKTSESKSESKPSESKADSKPASKKK